MENVIAPVNTPPVGNQSVTPTPVSVPAAEDPATELARLRQDKIEADKRLAEKDKHINDLSTTNATLENRLSGYQAVESVIPRTNEAPEASETPETPVNRVSSNGVRPEDIPEIIDRTNFLAQMKTENKDLMEFGLEDVIATKARLFMNTGKGFKESVLLAVKEQREKFEKIKQPSASTPATPVPSGLQGESGASVPLAPVVKTEEALGDEGEERRKLRLKRGL